MEIVAELLNKKSFEKNIKIRDFSVKIYEGTDFEDLMDLYERVFPGYMSKEFWLWKNVKNPFGKYFTFLMKNNDVLIGAYSVAPRIFYIQGEKVPCAQSLDTMTDKNYSGRGISTYLAKLTYEYAKIKGNYFVYGFPNNNSIYMFENKLNWINFGQINLFSKGISKNIYHYSNIDFTVEEIEYFDDSYEIFWKEQKLYYSFIIEKGKDYLNWRFCHHPNIKYRKFLIYNNKTNEIVAYFILKKFNDKMGNFYGHIVDFMIDKKESHLRKIIFKIIESYSINIFRKDCCKITFWMPDKHLGKMLINELNYKIIKTETYFGYKPFYFSKNNLDKLKNLNNWYIMMSDDDVF